MLQLGNPAPDFELLNDQGQLIQLRKVLKKGPLLLYFYPADFTPGCTKEACDFRDQFPNVQEKNIQIFGISPQKVETHAKFRKHLNLPFDLLSDPQKNIIRAYGAEGPFGLGVRRITYLIGQDGLIKDCIKADFRISKHKNFLEKVLSAQN